LKSPSTTVWLLQYSLCLSGTNLDVVLKINVRNPASVAKTTTLTMTRTAHVVFVVTVLDPVASRSLMVVFISDCCVSIPVGFVIPKSQVENTRLEKGTLWIVASPMLTERSIDFHFKLDICIVTLALTIF